MGGLIVDNFAGGGGASVGIELALGRSPDIAVNHDPEALAMHEANHPGTRHLCESVWDVDPVEACAGRSVDLAWFSPDCTYFSKARGAKPLRTKEKKVRALAWVVVRWAKAVRPRVICVENVEEFQGWGPVAEDGRPCPLRRGFTFRRWRSALERLGYAVDVRELRACDFGAPTSRKRLFVVARCDGRNVVWPAPSHGPGKPKPYRTAADIIDWSLPCPSIFLDSAEARLLGVRRPLADATLRRIARGLEKFVFCGRPFVALTGSPAVAFLAKHFGGNGTPGGDLGLPLSTITTQDHHALVTASLGTSRPPQVRAFLAKYYGTGEGQRIDQPLGTITTRDRFGLVRVEGDEYEIDDIGMRMLAPRELFRAQGFPDSYQIDIAVGGKPLTKTAQVRMVGNSVSPAVASAIVAANCGNWLGASEPRQASLFEAVA